MRNSEIQIERGIPEAFRQDAAKLYDEAFGAKISLAIPDQKKRISVIEDSFQLSFGMAAVCKNELVGIAGFHTAEGSLTGGMDYRNLIDRLGFLGGNRAALVLSLYERKPLPGELVMDGIAVRSDMRGHGVGGRLLEELSSFAAERQFQTIRLDVIDANPRAKQLYERRNFEAIKTEEFGYLRWLLGFGGVTTMVRQIEA